MPMSPYQYPQYGVPGFQPQTMQQMVGQGHSPAPSFHPQPGISGRVVTGPGEIQVQEVPTDGTVAWFPAADGSCVWGKRWTPTAASAPSATWRRPRRPRRRRIPWRR